MPILSQRTKHARQHPPWCDTVRCHSDSARLGEHRSAPLTLGRRGRIVIVLSQRRHDATPRMETRIVTPLTPVAGDAGRRHAVALTRRIIAAIRLARIDHSRHTGSSGAQPQRAANNGRWC